ncbi:MAG: hypothetical protein CL624_03120 [Arcobacter sp.]|nr:hypothetical protein [Arcobacter sp.]
MKKILLTFLLFSSFCFADITASFPKLTGQVVDRANLLTQSQKETLQSTLKAHEEETSNQIVLVTLNSLEGYEIAEYSYQLGRYWQIGQKDKNNGVLLVISLNDKKLRIEVGYGLEGALTDKISHEIIEYTLKPKFRQNQYYQGIQEATNKIISAIKGEYIQNKKVENNSSTSELFPIFFFMIIFVSMVFTNISKKLRHKILYKTSQSSLFSSFFSFFIYAFSTEFTSSNIAFSLIAFITIFIISFLSMKKVDFDKIKRASKNTSSTYGSGYSGGFGGGGFSSSSSGGFSGGGGSFGGGGASGGW